MCTRGPSGIFVAVRVPRCACVFFFFFNDTATTEIYTLSLHDALPIPRSTRGFPTRASGSIRPASCPSDRKSTRLNSSHLVISYAVFCLKKKNHNTAIPLFEYDKLVPVINTECQHCQ